LQVSTIRRRDRIQIIAEIIDSCLRPQAKTRVMYDVGLSYRQLQSYLYEMLKLGLIETRYDKRIYITTEKGLRFLEKWIQIQQILTRRNQPSFVLLSSSNQSLNEL
jgi:predicted transcriptional regulator